MSAVVNDAMPLKSGELLRITFGFNWERIDHPVRVAPSVLKAICAFLVTRKGIISVPFPCVMTAVPSGSSDAEEVMVSSTSL